VYNIFGDVVGETELCDDVFGIQPNDGVMHQALIMQRANARLSSAHTKTRASVSGGGRKPWRQKGTGRARHGSIRSPLWKGGGTVFGPTKERNYRQKMPRKMRRLAYRSALSAKAAEGQIIVLDDFQMSVPRTREVVGILDRLGVYTSALILLPERNENVEKSVGNLLDVKTLRAQYLNVRDLLGYDYVIMPLGAKEVIEGILG